MGQNQHLIDLELLRKIMKNPIMKHQMNPQLFRLSPSESKTSITFTLKMKSSKMKTISRHLPQEIDSKLEALALKSVQLTDSSASRNLGRAHRRSKQG